MERVVVATYLHSAIAEDLSKEVYVVLPTTISQEIPKWMKKWSDQDQVASTENRKIGKKDEGKHSKSKSVYR